MLNGNMLVNVLRNDPRYRNNQTVQNAVNLYAQGQSKELHQLARNVCNSTGNSYDNLRKRIPM